MSGWLVILIGIVYFYISIEQLIKGNVPMAVTYASYSTANIGLWMMIK